MAEISKQALIVENNQSFPNNNNGQITPSALRDFNRDMIDSTVNQIAFNNYTQSFTDAFNALNGFTASIQQTNAFTQSADQRLDDLESWSSSLDVSYASQAEFNSFTQSTDNRLDNLENWSSSLDTNYASQTEFNSYTQSNDAKVNALIAFTSSVLSTAALVPLNEFTASVAGTNAFTASQQLLNGTFATTGSNVFVGANTFTAGNTTFDFTTILTNNASLQNYSGSTITFGLSTTTGSNYTLKSNPFEPVLLITRESDNAKPIQMDWRDNKVTLAESGAVEIAPSAFGGFKVNTTASFYGRNVWLIADGFTSSLAYVTASVSGSDSNLIFKNNALTTATVVSGSSNIFQSPGAATATFRRYVGGSGNIFITSGSVPQLTGSVSISPVMNGNIINGAGTISLRTPVSSSAYTISHNTIAGGNINFGSAAATSFVSASAGLNFSNNFSNATIIAVANKTTLVNAPNLTTNNLGGVLTLNMDSSSIGFTSNNLQGSLTINNLYSGSTAAGNFMIAANGLFVGSNYTLVASGSNTTLTTPRQFSNNVMLGSAHSASINLLGDNSNLNSTALIGHGLNVTGSSALQTAATQAADRGTVIVGRFNTDVLSNNTVFVVGTGTSTSSRRNGLLIDSGSNAFLSGSLNMAGNSSFTGSMNFLSGSASGSVITNVGDTFTGTDVVTKIISLSSAEYTALSPKDPNTLYIII